MNLGIDPDLPIMQCMGALFMELPDPVEVPLIILSTILSTISLAIHYYKKLPLLIKNKSLVKIASRLAY